jgi:hypothetical protein
MPPALSLVGSDLDIENLLSGTAGKVTGRRERLRARAHDVLCDAALWSRLVPLRLDAAARRLSNPGAVQVFGVYSASWAGMMARAVEELRRSRRDVAVALGALDEPVAPLGVHTVADGLRGRGKFENLNTLLREAPELAPEWVVVIDDDVELPRKFLDRFLVVAERFELQLAQPALRRASHAAWAVCRRECSSLARLTRLVEIGPLTAFHRSVMPELLPFPPLRMGWGLDLHWGGLAGERGWRLGVVDAVSIGHEARETASTYDWRSAVEELRSFLAERPHIDREQALTVVERHRSWRHG